MKTSTAKKYVELRTQGYEELYYLDVGGRDCLFRPLSYDEYRLVLDLERHFDGPFINDTICRLSVMHIDGDVEELLSSCKGGYADAIAHMVIGKSGYQDPQRFLAVIHKKRQEAMELSGIMEAMSCMVFKYTPDEYRGFTMEKQAELFAKAEQVLGQPLDVEAILARDEAGEMPEFDVPVPEGMQSAAVDPRAAEGHVPDFDKIMRGEGD